MPERLNLLAPDIRADPYPAYARLRRDAPVSQVDPGGLWAVSRHEDILHVLKHPQHFSSEGIRQAYRPAWISNDPLADSMLVMDPPQHTRLRSLVNRAFGTSVLTRLEPLVKRLAERIARELPEGQEVDFVASFAVPMPMGVLGELLGLSPETHPSLIRWTQQLARFTSIGPADTGRQEAMRATVEEVRGQFERVLEERRAHLGDDLVSDLLRARVEGEHLSNEELLGFMFLLLIGGLETTLHLMTHSALRLHLQPEWMTTLREQPALVPRFVEEILRHEPPAHGIPRFTRLSAGTRPLEWNSSLIVRGPARLPLVAHRD